MENPTKMDDLGVPLFWKHPYINTSIFVPPFLLGGRNKTKMSDLEISQLYP